MVAKLIDLWQKYGEIEQIVRALNAGDIAATALTDEAFCQIERINPTLHSLISVANKDRAIDVNGPLRGVPVVVKDNIDVQGLPTTLGLASRVDQVDADAAVVKALREAGAVVVGKSNLPALASSAMGVNEAFGHALNAVDPSKTAGGSSGGSASAVAAGMALAALGTDTAGSVVIPAALNGIVGYRPTTGTFDMRGVAPLSPTFDTVGIFALSVKDAAHVSAVINRRPAGPYPSHANMQIRVGLVEGWFAETAPDVAESLRAAVGRWSSRGIDIERVRLDGVADAVEAGRTIYRHEAAESLRKLLDEGPTYEPAVEARRTSALTSSQVEDANGTRREWITEYQRLASQFDCLAFATTPMTAPSAAAPVETTTTRLVRNTYPVAVAAAPAISLPLRTQRQTLPTGVLLSGSSGEDNQLLAVAAELGYLLDEPHPREDRSRGHQKMKGERQ